MPYACSNNGLTAVWHDPGENYQPKAGETMLNSIGSATLSQTFPGYTAAVAAQAAIAQGAVDLATKIANGIAITSTGTPALNATYALDPVTQDQISSVAMAAASGLGLPGGLSTFTYPDMAGNPHTFASADIQNLYKAMRNLLLQLNTQAAIEQAGGTATWPSQSATIA